MKKLPLTIMTLALTALPVSSLAVTPVGGGTPTSQGQGAGTLGAFQPIVEYLSGVPAAATIAEDATDALTADDSVLVEVQRPKITYLEDVMMMNTRFLDYNCVDYRWLGECMSIKTSFPPAIGWSSIAENRVGDLQVEITSRLPDPVETTDIINGAANSPTDLTLGGLQQNAAAFLGRLLNPVSGDFGWTEILAYTPNSTTNEADQDFLFREALLIGNPTLSATMNPYSSLPGFCSSAEAPYATYFTSALDSFSWRWFASSEMVMLGMYNIEYMDWDDVGVTSDFGSVFPRSGYVVTNYDFNAALTAAYRAISITNDHRPHYSGVAGLHMHVPNSPWASGSYTLPIYSTIKDHVSVRLSKMYPTPSPLCQNYLSHTQEMKDLENKWFVEMNKERTGAFKVYRPLRCCQRKYSHIAPIFMVPHQFNVF